MLYKDPRSHMYMSSDKPGHPRPGLLRLMIPIYSHFLVDNVWIDCGRFVLIYASVRLTIITVLYGTVP